MKNRAPGFTLIELAIVLTLLAALLTAAAPSLASSRNALAVGAARNELIAAIAITRAAAVLDAGATLLVDCDAGVLTILAADGTPVGPVRPLRADHGVALRSNRGARVSLRYDGLGIGRLTNATFRIERGRASAAVTVSAYGRAR